MLSASVILACDIGLDARFLCERPWRWFCWLTVLDWVSTSLAGSGGGSVYYLGLWHWPWCLLLRFAALLEILLDQGVGLGVLAATASVSDFLERGVSLDVRFFGLLRQWQFLWITVSTSTPTSLACSGVRYLGLRWKYWRLLLWLAPTASASLACV